MVAGWDWVLRAVGGKSEGVKKYQSPVIKTVIGM